MNNKCAEKYHRMLVINGGGVKGIIPARILQEFETITGKKVTDLFDSVVGTSVGGIIAAAMFVPDSTDSNKPKYSPEYMVNLMLDRSGEIFPEKGLFGSAYTTGAFAISGMAAGAGIGSLTGPVGTVIGSILGATGSLSAQSYGNNGDGIITAKYGTEGLENILKEHFGNLNLTDTIKPVTLTSFSLDQDGPRIWSTFRAEKDPSQYNFYLKDATAATSAAPTYFRPHVTNLPDGRTFIDVDGALFANHPVFVGARTLRDVYAGKGETLSCSDTYDRLIVVSLGTGYTAKKGLDHLSEWSPNGGLAWMFGKNRITDTLIRAGEESDEIASGIFSHSVMINVEIEDSISELDNSKRDNLLALKSITEQYIFSKNEKIKKLALCLNEVTQKNSIDTENCSGLFEKAPTIFDEESEKTEKHHENQKEEPEKQKIYDADIPPTHKDYLYGDTPEKETAGDDAKHTEL